MTPTALISGGAGFIGSHLAESILDNGARVIVLDNYTTGKDVHVKHLINNPNFAFYNVDINQGIPSEIESVDYIFHLAGLEEYLYSKEYINLDTLLTNSLGVKNLLDLSRNSQAKFMLASTIDVYQGRMSQLDLARYFGENAFDENKFSLIEAKRFAEAIVWEYYKKFDLDARIVRLPEVYGPRMNLESSGSLGNYLKNIIEGTAITIYGDGYEKERYLYINDAISGILKSQFSIPTKGNIYTLIPDNPISSLELAYLVKKIADGEVAIVYKERVGSPSHDIKNPDTYNYRDIDWKPRTELKTGIIKTLEWFGYAPNLNSFKPGKMIDQKLQISSITSGIPEAPKQEEKPLRREQVLKPLTPPREEEPPPLSYQTQPAPVPVPEASTPTYKNIQSYVDAQRVNQIKRPKFKFSLPKFSFPKIGTGIKPNFNFGLGSRIGAIIFSALAIFIVLPVISIYFSVKLGVQNLEKAALSVQRFDSNQVVKNSAEASSNFKRARSSLSILRWLFITVGQKNTFNSVDKTLSSLQYFSQAANNAGLVVKPVENIIESIRPDSTTQFDKSSLDQAQLGISKAETSLSLAQADFALVNKDLFGPKVRVKMDLYEKYLTDISTSLGTAKPLLASFSDILGIGGERNYIVWFQNSNEIRPTGGFIGSYGILKLNNGKLKEIIIDDIYNPDGQIDLRNISVSAPQPIVEYLGEKNLHLRNVNWDPDFTKSTKAFDDLYFKVTGEVIDGYLAIDLNFVKSLLKVTGPVYLASYNEEITPENLYERTQFHSDFNYENGSDQKRSFLTVLGGKLMEKLFALPRDKFPALLGQLGSSFTEKHLLVYFMNSPFNAVLADKKWDGSLTSVTQDYLYVVNSNLGGTKANYYVKNKMFYEVTSMTRDGLLRGNVYLDYEHTGTDNAWPGGPYKNYVRVLTQKGAKLTGAKLIQEGKEEDIMSKVVVNKVGQYDSFEIGFTLNPTKSLKIIINYDLPVRLSVTKDNPIYGLFWQKQPGTENDAYAFSFNPPFGMNVKEYNNGLKLEENILKSGGVLNTNLDYFIRLQ